MGVNVGGSHMLGLSEVGSNWEKKVVVRVERRGS